MQRAVLKEYQVITTGRIRAAASASRPDGTRDGPGAEPARVALSPLDHCLTSATFYSSLVYEADLDVALLGQSLAATLCSFPLLSGQLQLVKASTKRRPGPGTAPGRARAAAAWPCACSRSRRPPLQGAAAGCMRTARRAR
jgi:hypothetical protein